MKNKYFLLMALLASLSFLSFTNSTKINEAKNPKSHSSSFGDTVIIEIPRTEKTKRPSGSYRLIKQKCSQLNLDSLELGYDSIQIRIWFANSTSEDIDDEKLLILKKRKSQWSACFYKLRVEWDTNNGLINTVMSSQEKIVTPKSSWDILENKIFKLGLNKMPNMGDFVRHNRFEDVGEKVYYIEVATQKKYKCFSYWMIDEYASKFQQVNNMKKILALLKIEFPDWRFLEN